MSMYPIPSFPCLYVYVNFPVATDKKYVRRAHLHCYWEKVMETSEKTFVKREDKMDKRDRNKGIELSMLITVTSEINLILHCNSTIMQILTVE